MALIFAVVGIEQWITRDSSGTRSCSSGNAYAPFYRVNSVFWDPSIYGRFLVVAILATLVVALLARGRATLAGGRAAIGASGSVCLLLFAVELRGADCRRRARRVFAGAGARLLARSRSARSCSCSPPLPPRTSVTRPPPDERRALTASTSGRSKLVTNGLKIAEHHPAGGVGLGGFKRAYAKQAHLRSKEPKAGASHDTPITVAAETGSSASLLVLARCREPRCWRSAVATAIWPA